MNNHDFCWHWARAIADDHGIGTRQFSVCGPFCKQYHVQGPDGFSEYIRACCKWSARAEAYAKFVERRAA